MDEKSDGQDKGVRPLEEGDRLWTARLLFDDYRPGCHCP
jgi:hypothetical protein